MLHMARRDWFDDDEFIEDDGDLLDDLNFDIDDDNMQAILSNGGAPLDSKANNNFLDSVQEDVENMKLSELQAALKKRGMKSSGSKSVLKDRLLRSLLEDSGLNN